MKAEWIYSKSPESCETKIAVQPLLGVCKNSSFFFEFKENILYTNMLYIVHTCVGQKALLYFGLLSAVS